MNKIVLKTAKRATVVPRSAVRSAVAGLFGRPAAGPLPAGEQKSAAKARRLTATKAA